MQYHARRFWRGSVLPRTDRLRALQALHLRRIRNLDRCGRPPSMYVPSLVCILVDVFLACASPVCTLLAPSLPVRPRWDPCQLPSCGCTMFFLLAYLSGVVLIASPSTASIHPYSLSSLCYTLSSPPSYLLPRFHSTWIASCSEPPYLQSAIGYLTPADGSALLDS